MMEARILHHTVVTRKSYKKKLRPKMGSTQFMPRGGAHFLYRLGAAGFQCWDNCNVPVWLVCRCQNFRQVNERERAL